MNCMRVKSFGSVAMSVVGVLALASCSSSGKPAQPSTSTVTSPASSTTASSPTTTSGSTIAPAGPTTTTATTHPTTPATQSAPAVSATFVSPNQGFALEQNGRIAATADGGASWKAVGSLPGNVDNGRIRFIGPSDGFAFTPGQGPLRITHDAGATWINVDTPFVNVYDLAILRGMIYVVGMPPKNTGSFGIWSTPTGHLVWKRDPLALPIGAGPVPTEQIVLAGSGGWILNVNRTVTSGARLSAGNHWSAWNPPCLGKNGPAYLAASTSTNLIATCEEGIWGPPARANALYLSHNGGTTFTGRPAIGYGPVAAASPTTAIIGGNGILWRTTDGGAGWSVVAKFKNAAAIPSDLGFTNTTQGFVIVQNGEMLMTHDGGATWQAATLP